MMRTQLFSRSPTSPSSFFLNTAVVGLIAKLRGNIALGLLLCLFKLTMPIIPLLLIPTGTWGA